MIPQRKYFHCYHDALARAQIALKSDTLLLHELKLEGENEMQYLDALESLRTQGFPDEPVISRRYEILQRFMEGVRNGDLRRNLATMYAHEHYLNDPPTVEALRYATQQYLRTRGPSTQQQS